MIFDILLTVLLDLAFPLLHRLAWAGRLGTIPPPPGRLLQRRQRLQRPQRPQLHNDTTTQLHNNSNYYNNYYNYYDDNYNSYDSKAPHNDGDDCDDWHVSDYDDDCGQHYYDDCHCYSVCDRSYSVYSCAQALALVLVFSLVLALAFKLALVLTLVLV